MPLPLPIVITIQVVQNAILFAIMIFGGLFYASRVGLGVPIMEAATRSERVPDKVPAILPLSIVLGVIITVFVLALEFFYFEPALQKRSRLGFL